MFRSLLTGLVVALVVYALIALVLWVIYGTWDVYASLPLVAAVAVGLTVAVVNSAGTSMLKDIQSKYASLGDDELSSAVRNDLRLDDSRSYRPSPPPLRRAQPVMRRSEDYEEDGESFI